MPSTDPWSFQWLATLGVGGTLAAFMFVFYRKDVRQYTDLWKSQSESLLAVVTANTAVVTKLEAVVSALHRRLDMMEHNVRWCPLLPGTSPDCELEPRQREVRNVTREARDREQR